MLAETLIAVMLGILCGIITGITPGIHVNLVSAFLISISSFLLGFASPLSLCVFIMSLAITHSFLDTIPSIYLGAPNEETALSVLPGQKMLLQGEAYQAVKLTITGTFCGLLCAIILIPLFIFIASKLYPILKPFLPFLLLAIICYMILRDKNRYWALLVFLFSGTLGILTFSLAGLKDPLFPLLSGLFGVSGLIISFFENTSIPLQKIDKTIDIKPKDIAKVLFGSSIAVFLIQFFPGMGPSQGAVISNQIIKDIKDKAYLALVGAMGTMSVVFSLVTFYTLGKAKDGSIVAMSKLMQIELGSFLVLVSCFLLAGSIAVFLTLFFAKKFSKLIEKVNYKMLVCAIIIFIFVLGSVLGGALGIIVLISSTAIGLIAPLKNVGRNHAMGCLLLPVLFYLLA